MSHYAVWRGWSPAEVKQANTYELERIGKRLIDEEG